MDIPLDEAIYVEAISSSSTGAAADADSTPTFAVYEESTDTDIGIGGNMTKRTSLTGNYRASFTASAANGFELGKWYAVIGSATIGGIATKGVLARFRIVAAEAVAGYPLTDVTKWLGGTIPAVNVTGVPIVDDKYLLGTVYATPNTAGLMDVNAKQGGGVAWNSGSITSSTLAADSIGSSQLAATGSSRGTSTLTQTQVTGGAYALSTDANGRVRIVDGTAAGEIDTSSGAIAHVILADTLTTYTSNTPQTGDSFARIGATGSGLTSLAPSVTALSTAQWTNTLATNLGTLAGHDPGETIMGATDLGTGSGFTSLPAMILDLTDGIETSITLRQAVRAIAAVATGKIADAGTGTETFKNIGGTTTRVIVTVDASGNRSAVTLSL